MALLILVGVWEGWSALQVTSLRGHNEIAQPFPMFLLAPLSLGKMSFDVLALPLPRFGGAAWFDFVFGKAYATTC